MDENPTDTGWYLDRDGIQRYWDGGQWTNALPPSDTRWPRAADQEQEPITPPHATWIQEQVRLVGGHRPSWTGSGTLLTEPVLVINRMMTTTLELSTAYAIFDHAGKQLGSVVQVGESALKKTLRFATGGGVLLGYRLEVRDNDGEVIQRLTRKAGFGGAGVVIERDNGEKIGEIASEGRITRIPLGLFLDGERIGRIRAADRGAPSHRMDGVPANFLVLAEGDDADELGTTIATITKTWVPGATTTFTSPDNYTVRVRRQLADPLASLVLAAAVVIDTVFVQDVRGGL